MKKAIEFEGDVKNNPNEVNEEAKTLKAYVKYINTAFKKTFDRWEQESAIEEHDFAEVRATQIGKLDDLKAFEGCNTLDEVIAKHAASFVENDAKSETSSSEDEDVTAANEGCAVEAPSIAASRANADASSVAHESTGGVTMHAPAEVAPASLSTFSQTRKRSGGVLQSIVSGEKGKKSSSVTEMTHEKLISLKEMQQNDQKEIELKNLLIQQEELVLHRKRADEKSEKPTHVLNRP
ncbi:hypothetical protein PF005_g6521 [Phytophthora fragariae]|uniref:Uncharacterized protein n=1 Tax=Phytophthora fragariae TaxID=53985 RepID=A0A6A3YSU2_9STRA|nr:hypothetical protein PF005_g6521 [Phytophthora fragariae]KAE9322566.1 hypothetical protein PF001_g4338 [Phytophthora fragariae]